VTWLSASTINNLGTIWELSLRLSHSLSDCVSQTVSLSFRLWISDCLTLFQAVTLRLSHSLSDCVSQTVSLSFRLCLSDSVSLSFRLCLTQTVSLRLSLSDCLSQTVSLFQTTSFTHYDINILLECHWKVGQGRLRFIFLKKLTLLFSKDEINVSNVPVKTFIWWDISISNKCCSFELPINQRILNKMYHDFHKKKLWAAQLFSTLIIIIKEMFLEQQIVTLEWFLKE